MMTPQEIREITFSKSMGGYKASEVDVFIDQVAETVESLYYEREETARKMELLADKIVEYRAKETSVQTALIDAHCAAERAVQEAQTKADALTAEAQTKADEMVAQAQARAAQLDATTEERAREQEREIKRGLIKKQRELDELTRRVSDFRSELLAAYRDHLRLIEVLPVAEDDGDEDGEDEQPQEQATAETEAAPLFSEPEIVTPEEETAEPSFAAGLMFGENYTLPED